MGNAENQSTLMIAEERTRVDLAPDSCLTENLSGLEHPTGLSEDEVAAALQGVETPPDVMALKGSSPK